MVAAVAPGATAPATAIPKAAVPEVTAPATAVQSDNTALGVDIATFLRVTMRIVEQLVLAMGSTPQTVTQPNLLGLICQLAGKELNIPLQDLCALADILLAGSSQEPRLLSASTATKQDQHGH